MKVETVLNYLLIGLIIVVLGSLFDFLTTVTSIWENTQNSVTSAKDYYESTSFGIYFFIGLVFVLTLYGLSKIPYHNLIKKIKRSTTHSTRPVPSSSNIPTRNLPTNPVVNRPVTGNRGGTMRPEPVQARPTPPRPITTRPTMVNDNRTPYTPTVADYVNSLSEGDYDDE